MVSIVSYSLLRDCEIFTNLRFKLYCRTRTISRSVYTDSQGNPVSQDVIQDINQFQVTTDNSVLVVLGNVITPLYVHCPGEQEERHYRRVVAVR